MFTLKLKEGGLPLCSKTNQFKAVIHKKASSAWNHHWQMFLGLPLDQRKNNMQ